jgi:hypothetical protein
MIRLSRLRKTACLTLDHIAKQEPLDPLRVELAHLCLFDENALSLSWPKLDSEQRL